MGEYPAKAAGHNRQHSTDASGPRIDDLVRVYDGRPEFETIEADCFPGMLPRGLPKTTQNYPEATKVDQTV